MNATLTSDEQSEDDDPEIDQKAQHEANLPDEPTPVVRNTIRSEKLYCVW